MTSSESYDVSIVGGGPGGYVAAIRSAQLGMRTLLIERDRVGGICLNWGCIPTKALLKASEIVASAEHAESFGIKLGGRLRLDVEGVVKRSRDAADALHRGVETLLRKNRVETVKGTARLTSPKELEISASDGSSRGVSSSHVVLATGARPNRIGGIDPDGKRVVDFYGAMTPKRIPKTILIIGGGAIGVEFASFYARMGSETTVVEMLPSLLAGEDEDVSRFVRERFEERGIRVILEARTESVSATSSRASAVVRSSSGGAETLRADLIVVAAGMTGNLDGLGLEDVGVTTSGGFISASAGGRTSVDGVRAVGDVCGPPLLAHKASHEGIACVESIASGEEGESLRRDRIPACTYGDPQTASVGLTEAEAKASGRPLKVGRFPFSASGKAIASGIGAGFVKTLFAADDGELLGAHMAGEGVSELIHGFALAMTLEATEEDVMRTIFPHPTLSETMHESALSAFGRAVHV